MFSSDLDLGHCSCSCPKTLVHSKSFWVATSYEWFLMFPKTLRCNWVALKRAQEASIYISEFE
jgi:hypothetical protein